MDKPILVNPPEFSEQERGWAEACEAGLDEVDPHEKGKEHPVGMDEEGEKS